VCGHVVPESTVATLENGMRALASAARQA